MAAVRAGGTVRVCAGLLVYEQHPHVALWALQAALLDSETACGEKKETSLCVQAGVVSSTFLLELKAM